MSAVHAPMSSASPHDAQPELWRRNPGRVVLLDNASHKPASGQASQTADALLRALTDAGWEPRRIDAHERGMESALDTLANSEADLVLAFGGDGTIAASADRAIALDAALLPIPGGTMNLSAKDIGCLSADASLVDRCMLGTEHRIDVARINGRAFLHSVAIGLVPAIGRQREAFRSRNGIIGRCVAVTDAARIAMLQRRQPVTIRTGVGSDRRETLCVVVSNNRLIRHHTVAFGRASTDAGTLGIYASAHRGMIGRWRLLQTLLTGQLERDRGFKSASVDQLALEADRRSMAVSVDGEIVSMRPPLVVTQQPRALRVIVPGSPQEHRS